MAEEIKKTDQSELAEQDLDKVAGGAPDKITGKFKFEKLPTDTVTMKPIPVYDPPLAELKIKKA